MTNLYTQKLLDRFLQKILIFFIDTPGQFKD